jgi:hypothetical protein
MGTVLLDTETLARTGRLFACPSFLTGSARVLDLAATFDRYNEDLTPEEADSLALWSDWAAVGDDLRVALSEFAKKEDTANLPT